LKDLWVPISGAIAQQKNVETIANNVANANTPAFKKDQVVFKEYLSAYEKGTDIDLPSKEWAPEDFYRTYGAEKAQVKVDGTYTVHSQGQLTPSNNPLDFAISGKGFFEILSPNGVRYTRKGSFSLDSEGRLVTDNGLPLLNRVELPKVGEGDDIIGAVAQIPKPEDRIIRLPPGKFHVNHEGEVYFGENKITTLSLIEFKDIHALKKEGTSFFLNENSKNIRNETPKSKILQGFVEQSNVNAIEEMSALIKAHRQFESIQKVIRAYDSMSEKGINEIGRF
jgi:flagellar basal-body rod protein FlgF